MLKFNRVSHFTAHELSWDVELDAIINHDAKLFPNSNYEWLNKFGSVYIIKFNILAASPIAAKYFCKIERRKIHQTFSTFISCNGINNVMDGCCVAVAF